MSPFHLGLVLCLLFTLLPLVHTLVVRFSPRLLPSVCLSPLLYFQISSVRVPFSKLFAKTKQQCPMLGYTSFPCVFSSLSVPTFRPGCGDSSRYRGRVAGRERAGPGHAVPPGQGGGRRRGGCVWRAVPAGSALGSPPCPGPSPWAAPGRRGGLAAGGCLRRYGVGVPAVGAAGAAVRGGRGGPGSPRGGPAAV